MDKNKPYVQKPVYLETRIYRSLYVELLSYKKLRHELEKNTHGFEKGATSREMDRLSWQQKSYKLLKKHLFFIVF